MIRIPGKYCRKEKLIRFEESNFIPDAVQLATRDSKELDDIAESVLY